jgi:hypothetical protein
MEKREPGAVDRPVDTLPAEMSKRRRLHVQERSNDAADRERLLERRSDRALKQPLAELPTVIERGESRKLVDETDDLFSIVGAIHAAAEHLGDDRRRITVVLLDRDPEPKRIGTHREANAGTNSRRRPQSRSAPDPRSYSRRWMPSARISV